MVVNNQIIYYPYRGVVTYIFITLLIILSVFIFTGVAGIAFVKAGIPRFMIPLLLTSMILFSTINIPIIRREYSRIGIFFEEYSFLGITYRVPVFRSRRMETVIAVNIGGAVIPCIIALYIIISYWIYMWEMLTSIILVAIVTNIVAKPVKGIGIVAPALVPPLIAAIVAFITVPLNPAPIAFVSGTLGTLIGADLLNLHRIHDLEARFVSIGGAGIFDGIFLSGILAALLA